MLKYQQVDIKNIVIIIATWIVLVILVNPIGDFPLNDDWAYGWSVKTLLETGNFQLSDWTATNLLSQVIWGALFCLPFGFSFTALRLSTLTLGLIGVLTTYGLLREVNTSPKISLLGALIIALNPLYFALSNSFMSDVPSFTFTFVSLYFLIRGLKRESNIEFFLGVLISFISILNRQLGLLILPTFSLAYLIKKGFKIRTFIEAITPTILGIALYISYPRWLQATDRAPILYNFQSHKLVETFSKSFLEIVAIYSKNILLISVYLGLFIFPFLILNFSIQFKNFSLRQKQISLFFSFFIVAIISVYCLAKHQRMPFVGNVIESFGLGPQTINGYSAFLNPNLTLITLISRVWQILTLVSMVGVALLFQCLFLALLQVFNQKTDLNRKWLLMLTISSIILFFLPIAGLKGFWFDRYLIIFLPFLLMLISMAITNYSKNKLTLRAASICLMMLLFYGGFTITATHDYLLWNRVRWQAVNDLMQTSQILPNQINGGFEFKGWYFGNKLEICNPKYHKSSAYTRVNWNDFTCLWGSDNYKYSLSFVPNIGYEIEKKYSFRRWLPWRKEDLYLLRKKTKI